MSPLKEVGKLISKSLVRGMGEAPALTKPFYSPLDKAISEITQTKGTGQQIEQILKKTKGVSKELKDRPVIQDLLKQPKITKAQLEKAAAEHPAAQVTEKVEKGPSETRYRVEHDELNNKFDVVDDYSDVVKSFRDYDDAESYAARLQGGTTKYEDYQLPGGKNYREVKLMLPTQPKKETWEWFDPITQESSRGFATQQAAYDARPNISAVVAKVEAKDSPQSFLSAHFDEPNILAHARVSDRVGPNGEKILHVEEIQSDWHQKGRKKGYNNPPMKGEVKIQEGYDPSRADQFEPEGNAPTWAVYWEDGTFSGGYGSRSEAESRLRNAAYEKADIVPDAPFKQNWHELVMKRLLDDAVKKGYDKVVITPGAEQAKRYDLSKHFGEISYKHNEDGTISIIGTDKKSGLANLHEEDIQKDKLPEYVGKELAEKIMANVGTPYEGTSRMRQGSMTLSNLDLKVGGEGMEGFYDKMLPSFLNEYGKKWGASVGQHELSVPRKQPISSIQDAIDQGLVSKDEVLAMDQAQRNALMDSFRNENIPVHSFDITPQMREEITGKGQPLYQMIPAGVGAGTLAAPQEEVPEQPMKRGGAVSMDAMRLAVMNKQLRK